MLKLVTVRSRHTFVSCISSVVQGTHSRWQELRPSVLALEASLPFSQRRLAILEGYINAMIIFCFVKILLFRLDLE